MQITDIFVDIDGVLADFIGASFEAHGKKYDEATYPRLEWSIAKVLGITEDQFWERINAEEHTFWPFLHLYPWATELLVSVAPVAPVKLLSSPSRSHYCHSGKRQWVDRHCPEFELILCHSKHFLAAPGRLLIDDNDQNIDRWRARGGTGILFPQPWNSNHELLEDRMAYVRSEFCGYCTDEQANPKDAEGRKKAALRLVPSALMINVANVMKLGASKYGEYNWRTKRVNRTVYLEAAMRHILASLDGADIDPESGEPHEAHAAACMGIVLDALATGNLIDDRPTPGAATELMQLAAQ